ncbi:receptor-transporting protein 2-like isoform X2 [Lithobates pipiens]
MPREPSRNIWIDIFDELQETELEQRYGKTWVLQFNYNLKPTLTQEQRQNGWKISQTTTNGSFTCFRCQHFWNSGRVTLIFHYCLGRGKRGTVVLRPFEQSCRECNNNFYIKPTFNEEKVETILEKVILKIRKNCYKEDIDTGGQDRDRRVLRTKPHEKDHCEACAEGVCNKELDVA